jgi:hypothetical protein
MVNGTFVSDAMFFAGGHTNWGDVLRGGIVQSLPLRFYDRNFIVEIYKTSKGLIVVPHKQTGPPG